MKKQTKTVVDESEEGARLRSRAQAERIETDYYQFVAELRGFGYGSFRGVVLMNASNRPIRHVQCRTNRDGADSPDRSVRVHWGVVESASTSVGSFSHDPDAPSVLPVLRRGQRVSIITSARLALDRDDRFWVQFQDDSNLWWVLDGDMHLESIKSEARWSE